MLHAGFEAGLQSDSDWRCRQSIEVQTMFEKGLLAGKRILVTGGGSGFGAAMGRRFVELGAELIICGRRLELLEATATQIRNDLGGKVVSVGCDLRDGAAVDV